MIGAAPSVAEPIGTQIIKVLLVHMCLCLVGTHEFMFTCMNISVFYWYVCVFVGLVHELMLNFKNMSIFCGLYM